MLEYQFDRSDAAFDIYADGEDCSPWQTGNPPGPGWYLVTIKPPSYVSYPENYVDRLHFSGNHWTSLGGSSPGGAVLAWQPLPEPYRGDGI